MRLNDIIKSKDLTANEKLALIRINGLDNEDGCFASNEFLANELNLKKDTVSKLVSSLAKKGYITVELIYKKGSKEVEKRIIRIKEKIDFCNSSQEPKEETKVIPFRNKPTTGHKSRRDYEDSFISV